MLKGGIADKLGNDYEALWTLVEALRVLRGEADEIRIEPFDEDATMKGLSCVLAGIVLQCAATAAHHGYDDFFCEKRVAVEGVLEELHYANPHVTLKIRTDDGQLYTALWEGLTGVERRGGDRTTLTVGERVMVIGSPPRDPASRDIALLRQVKRLRDGWTWRTE